MSDFSRRRFLKGTSGLILPLPLLPSLQACSTPDPHSAAHPLVVLRCASGVAQEDGDVPEMFWPRELGPLSRSSLADDNADRITSELAAHAERVLMVRGTQYPFSATREVHAGGGNQLLTAAKPGPLTDTVMTYAMGESIDNWIARHSPVNHGEPLTLYAGRRDNYGEEVLSYRGPQQIRGADSDPWAVYQRLIGASGNQVLRDSINDHVLDQLHSLRASRRISAEDRTRLEQHTDSIRDFEVLCARLSGDREYLAEDLTGRSADDEVSLEVARLHCDIIALALRCDQARAVTLQIGDRLDRCRYEIDGFRLPTYHELTHGLVEPDEFGPYTYWWEMQADVNRLHQKLYSYLLDALLESDVLDRSVVVFCSDIATGSHRYDQIPWIIAGRGDGTLRTGEYVDAGGVTHNKLLNTLLTATGHRTEEGGPIEDFGDESLEGGLLDAALA